MNVMAVLHYGGFGGPPNRMMRLSDPLRAHGWNLTVVLPDEPGNTLERLRAAGVETLQLPLSRVRATSDPRAHARTVTRLPADIVRLRRAIREREADLVVLAGLSNPHGAIAAALEDVPIVWQIVDSRVPAPARRVLMWVAEHLSDTLMFWGNSIRRLHVGERRLRPPTTLGHSPVDIERFVPSPELRLEARAALGIPADALVIGSVANVTPQKGIEYFVRALDLIFRSRDDVWCIHAGAEASTHDRYADRIKRDLANTAIPPDRFISIGDRSDLERIYPAMDVKLITSVPASEGIPSTALEAMACGVPVVTTDVGSAAEAVIDGRTGLVVPPLDAAAIADATQRLLDDRGLRQQLGTTGRDRAVRHYALEHSLSCHLHAFALALDYHAHRRPSALTRIGRLI